jgi:hypothetical protein
MITDMNMVMSTDMSTDTITRKKNMPTIMDIPMIMKQNVTIPADTTMNILTIMVILTITEKIAPLVDQS